MSFTDILKQALADINQIAGQEIVYFRGSDWVKVKATRAKSVFNVKDADSLNVRFATVDWLIEAEDLKLNGSKVEPQKNDTIKSENPDGTYELHVVIRPEGNDDCFRYQDASGKAFYRIHSQPMNTLNS